MPAPFRYVTPVPPDAATGRVAEVYAQLGDDFGLPRMPVFMTLSPAPDVLAAAWATLRESLPAGAAPRTPKEVVALGVSLANRCPFCVAAHTTLLHATGDHRLGEAIARGETPADPVHAALLDWARATRDLAAAAPPAAPFAAAHAPEFVGTALAFHFINRTASALITDDLLPGGLHRSRLVRSASGRFLARAVRRRLPAGASLPLLDDLPAGPAPAWAGEAPVGPAFGALRAAALAGGDLLGARARAAVETAVAGWDGAHPPATWRPDVADGLPEADRAGARIALLAALAPYRLTDADVAAWRDGGRRHPGAARTDADLVRLTAFGAMTAVLRVEKLIGGTPISGEMTTL